MSLNRALKSYELAAPTIYNPDTVGEFFTPDYNVIMAESRAWAQKHAIKPRRKDKLVVGATFIDVQRTFCLEKGELSMAPKSVDDTRNICEFVYRNTRVISNIMATMDTHFLFQIFHPPFWLDVATDEFVKPFTCVLPEDIGKKYKVNPEMAYVLFGDMKLLGWLQEYVVKYTEELKRLGKPPLVIWPVHGLLGSPGHALVPAFQTAIQMHELARYSKTNYRVKGDRPLSEHYSPFGTEVVEVVIGGQKMTVGELSDLIVADLLGCTIQILGGEALSHCVGTGGDDLLKRIKKQDARLAEKVYFLEDCTSPVPGFEGQAEAFVKKFKAEGIHFVNSTTPMDEWPGVPKAIFDNIN